MVGSRLAVAAVCAWLGGLVPPTPEQAQFFSGVDTVAIYATVTGDGGRLARGLERDDFEVFDNGKKRTLTVFQNTPVPITMALMLDDSPSLVRAWPTTRIAAAAAVTRLGPDDRATVGFFNRAVRVAGHVTGDTEELLRRLSTTSTPVAGTALWDAIGAGMAALEDEPGRRVVLVLTDGNDNSSETSGPTVAMQAMRDGVMLYAIGLQGTERVNDQLGRLARDSGGWFFELKRNQDLEATFARVVDELRNQYVLGFSVDALDGAMHRLEVRVKQRGLKVRTRASYIASKMPRVGLSGDRQP